MPPAYSSSSARIGRPERHLVVAAGLFTGPDTEKSLVPGLFSVPHWRYHSAPFSTMQGTAQMVSTLLTTVGQA